MALRRNGYHVLEADSGSTGLAMARQHLPDLILSDINMRGGDGSRQGTKVEVKFDEEGQLTVTDQGRGMTSEEISGIAAFRQFDRKRQEQQGLGLGLVLVQKLASLLTADMKVSSQPGPGLACTSHFARATI